MANFLSTEARAYLEGPTIDHSRFQNLATLFVPGDVATVHTIPEENVVDWGEIEFATWNLSPGDRESAVYPDHELLVHNRAGKYAENVAGNVWGSYRPQEFRLRLQVILTLPSGTQETLLDVTLAVLDSWVDFDAVHITSTAELRRHLANPLDELSQAREWIAPAAWL